MIIINNIIPYTVLYRPLIFSQSSLVSTALVEGVCVRHRLGLSVPPIPSHPQRWLLRLYGTQNWKYHGHELPVYPQCYYHGYCVCYPNLHSPFSWQLPRFPFQNSHTAHCGPHASCHTWLQTWGTQEKNYYPDPRLSYWFKGRNMTEFGSMRSYTGVFYGSERCTTISLPKDVQTVPLCTHSKCGQGSIWAWSSDSNGVYSQDEAGIRKGKKGQN